MSSMKYAFLSLLAREPLSGYDIKQQMNGRVSFFYKVNNNQLYPVLSKLNDEGLVEIQSYTKETSRPARKVYRITDEGIAALKTWILSPEEGDARDDFLLKQYSSWLIKSEDMRTLLENKRQEHETRSREYKEKIASFRAEYPVINSDHPLFSSIAVLEMGVRLETGYAQWCTDMLEHYRADTI